MSADSVPKLLTYKQVADLLGVSDRTVWTLAKEGILKAVRFRHSVRFDLRDVETFIQQGKDANAP